MGFIRRSGRNRQGRGMWPVSLFYSIALFIHNLRHQRLWWRLQCSGVVRQKANSQLCEHGEPGTGGACASGEEWKPRRDAFFVSGFPALVPHFEWNLSRCAETEQDRISFRTSPVKTCKIGIYLHTVQFFMVWVASQSSGLLLGFFEFFFVGLFRWKILPFQNNAVLFSSQGTCGSREVTTVHRGMSTLGGWVCWHLQQPQWGDSACWVSCSDWQAASHFCPVRSWQGLNRNGQGRLDRNSCFLRCGSQEQIEKNQCQNVEIKPWQAGGGNFRNRGEFEF